MLTVTQTGPNTFTLPVPTEAGLEVRVGDLLFRSVQVPHLEGWFWEQRGHDPFAIVDNPRPVPPFVCIDGKHQELDEHCTLEWPGGDIDTLEVGYEGVIDFTESAPCQVRACVVYRGGAIIDPKKYVDWLNGIECGAGTSVLDVDVITPLAPVTEPSCVPELSAICWTPAGSKTPFRIKYQTQPDGTVTATFMHCWDGAWLRTQFAGSAAEFLAWVKLCQAGWGEPFANSERLRDG